MDVVFHGMDEALRKRAHQDPACTGMGTTLTGMYTVGPEAFVAHIGDSRAYLYRDGTLTQLTRDHTLARQCVDAGLPIPCRSWSHRLTHCLGAGGEHVRMDFHHFRLADGDQLLLCTDGLTDMIPDEEIARILSLDTPPREAAQGLLERALVGGGKDNITAILARYAIKTPAAGSVPLTD